MKAIKYLTVLLFLLANEISAQSKFSIGGIIMPQLSMVNGDVVVADGPNNGGPENTFTSKSTFKFAFGLETVYRFNDHSRLNLSLLYSKQGQEYDTYNYNSIYYPLTTSNYSTTINYFKIPLVYEYHFASEKKCTFYLGVGLYVAFIDDYTIDFDQLSNDPSDSFYGVIHAEKNSVHVQYTDNQQSSFEEYSTLSEEPYLAVDWGVTLRAGIEIKMNDKISIPVLLNFDYGATDIKNYNSKIEDYVVPGFSYSFWTFPAQENLTKTLTNSTLGLRTGILIRL